MNIFFRFILVVSLITTSVTTIAQSDQGVSIAASLTTPDESAMLDVQSTSKGMLLPRMTKADRDAILSPVKGLWIFQTDNTPGFYFWNSTAWQCMSCCCSSLDEGWKEIGSTGTLIGGAGIPNFGTCFSTVTTPSAGHQKLSIRKTASGTVQIKGEFIITCTTVGSSLNFRSLFSPGVLPEGYQPEVYGVTHLSPSMKNGVVYTINVNSDENIFSLNPGEVMISQTSSITSGSVLYIDVEYSVAP